MRWSFVICTPDLKLWDFQISEDRMGTNQHHLTSLKIRDLPWIDPESEDVMAFRNVGKYLPFDKA
jgi:hypothetical protein